MIPTKGQPSLLSLQWGQCCCPHCYAVLTADQEAVRFFCRYNRDAALFMLCTACAASYDASSPDERSRLRDACLHNIKSCSEGRRHFACTTLSAVMINGGDFRAAVENGTCELDRVAYEALTRSDEAILFINGRIVHWEGLPEATNRMSGPTSGRDQHQH